MSDLQIGPESAGMSHLLDDLCRYVSLLVRQYVDKRPRPMATDGPTTDSPVLDTDMLEEDRLAWQQLAAGMRRTPDRDHATLGDNDDVTGDDWESLDAEDFPMEEAKPKQTLPTDRQVPPPQPRQLVQQPKTCICQPTDRSLSCTEAAAH